MPPTHATPSERRARPTIVERCGEGSSGNSRPRRPHDGLGCAGDSQWRSACCSDKDEQQLLVTSAHVLAGDTGGADGPIATSTCGGDLGGSVTISYPGESNAARDGRVDSLAYCTRWDATLAPTSRPSTPAPSAASAPSGWWWCSPRGTRFKVEPSLSREEAGTTSWCVTTEQPASLSAVRIWGRAWSWSRLSPSWSGEWR